MDTILTVRELNFKLNQVLEARFPYLWIKGEVTNCVRASSGHLYFSLKDEQDLLNCVWFKRSQQDLAFDPLTGECFEDGCKPSLARSLRDGQEIICAGKLAVYGARGQYQLIVEHAIESGTGQLYEAFEKLKQKLSREGLFDARHKKTLPASVRNVALITAPTGAVIHDFLRIADTRGVKSRICIFPSLVQGDEAPQQLITALKKAENFIFPDSRKADCIVLIRGGGSIQDLWAFNGEELARAIFACTIPVVTGIGHEPDFSIADYVSDKSLATPSHAAQYLWKDKNTLLQEIDDLEYTLQTAFLEKLRHKERELAFLSKNLEFVSPKTRLSEKLLRLTMLRTRLHAGVNKILQTRQNKTALALEIIKQHKPQFQALEQSLQRFEKDLTRAQTEKILRGAALLNRLQIQLNTAFARHIEKKVFSLQEYFLRLEGSNPQKPLGKGYLYAEILNKKQKTVKSVNDLDINDTLQLYVFDGTVQTKVEQISINKKDTL